MVRSPGKPTVVPSRGAGVNQDLWSAVASVLRSDLALPDLCRTVLKAVVAFLPGVDAGYILLYDEWTRRLELAAVQNYPTNPLQGLAFELGEGLAGKALILGTVQLAGRKGQFEQILAGLSAGNRNRLNSAAGALGLVVHAACAAPLVAAGKTLGVLELHGLHEEAAFPPQIVDVLATAAVPLAHGILCRQLQDRFDAMDASSEPALVAEALTMLSHQIRSPLAAIKGYVSTLLREDVHWDQGTVRDFLEMIERGADNVATVVDTILDSSALEAGLLPLDREPVLLHALCQKIVNELQPDAPGHRFAIAFPTDFPLVEADAARIEQVVRNLIDNAIKYSDGGLIVIRGELGRGEVVLSVADEGIGIQPEHLNRLFEKFYRIPSARRCVKGSGLGLPIARQMVEAHGGRIWATSKVGSGSCLYVSLPVSLEE